MFSIQVSLIVLHYTSGYSLQHKTNCAFIFKHTVLGAVLQDRNNNLLLMDRQTIHLPTKIQFLLFLKKQLNKSSLSFTFEGTTVQLPVSFQLPLARLTQPTSTIWWRGLNATNSHTQGKKLSFSLTSTARAEAAKTSSSKATRSPMPFR